MVSKGRRRSLRTQRDLWVLGSAAPTVGQPSNDRGLKGKTEIFHIADGHAEMHVCQVIPVVLSGVPKVGHKIMTEL